jgi:hypothetical protein
MGANAEIYKQEGHRPGQRPPGELFDARGGHHQVVPGQDEENARTSR